MSRVVHFEVHAEDPQRAIGFYSSVFGWQFNRWGEQEYWLVTTGPEDQPGINGGLIKRKGDLDGTAVIAYVCSVEVASIDKVETAITTNGGTIVVPKHAIPGVGWLFYAKDTEGNVFGVTQPDPGAGL